MDPGVIRDQVDRILHSQSFATKGQLRKLLEVLLKNIDSQAALTTELVIQELWPAETKTKHAKDVATEMNRLRHAVESYYNGEGEADRVIIYFPKRAPSGDGRQETRWMDATLRNGVEAHTPVPLPSPATVQTPEPQPSPQAETRQSWKRAALMMASLCAVLLIVGYVSFRLLAGRGQPQFGRLDGSAVVIMNAEGKELWRKAFPDGFGPDWSYKKDSGLPIWFADLEGKGHTSVLFSYLPARGSQPQSSTLICYSDSGKEKWRWSPGRNLPELNGSPAIFRTMALAVLKATPKRPLRIVAANMDPWWPSQIAVLDSNGKTISEYWHSGQLAYMILADLDGDGREQIIATGIANGYDHQATLVVLDPDRVFGASTEARPEFQIHGMGVAEERLRLLFPRSDLNRASSSPFNDAIEPIVRDDKLRLTVQECPAPKGCPIRYEFDKNLCLITAYAGGDEFRGAHDRFYQNGRDAHTLGLKEQAVFVKVRCLVGCKSEFVPTAENYDPATSFEMGWATRSNPNGVWSYGYSSGFTNPITLYDKTVQNGVNGPNAQYWFSPAVDVGTSPAAEYNDGAAYNDGNIDFLANELLLVAGVGGQYSNLVFTTPTAGEYAVTGSFRGAQYLVGTAVGIAANGKVVFSSSVSSVGELVPFRNKLDLPARSRVVFSVGPGRAMQNTGISVSITKPCAVTDSPTSTQTGEITCSGRPTGK